MEIHSAFMPLPYLADSHRKLHPVRIRPRLVSDFSKGEGWYIEESFLFFTHTRVRQAGLSQEEGKKKKKGKRASKLAGLLIYLLPCYPYYPSSPPPLINTLPTVSVKPRRLFFSIFLVFFGGEKKKKPSFNLGVGNESRREFGLVGVY